MELNYQKKFARIIASLASKTAAKQLDWSIAASGGVLTTIGSQFVTLNLTQEEYGPDVELGIYDVATGNLVERVTDGELSEAPLPSTTHSGWFSYMSALLETATRQAKGVDAALDELLAALERK